MGLQKWSCNMSIKKHLTETSEEALHASELRYRRLFEAAKDGILILDAKTGMIVDVNPFLIQLLGFTHEAFLGKKIWELGIFKDIAANEAKFAELQAQEYVRYEDLPLETADGQKIAVEFISNVYSENRHKVVQCNIRDNTDHKREEEALNESRQITKGILNAMPVRVFWKDKDLVYLGCNVAFANDAGFTDPKEIIGKDDYQMGWRDQAELYRRDDRQVIESGCPKLLIEEPQTTPDGNTITLLASKIPLRNSNGEIRGVLGTYIDITERKRVNTQMKLQSGALEAAANAIVITDNKGVIEWANPAFTTYTGYSAAEAIGKTPSLLKSGEHDQAFYQALWDTILAGKVWHGEVTNRRKDGTFYTEEMTITPIKDADGKISHFIAVKQDITERKRAEIVLQDSETRYHSLFENMREGFSYCRMILEQGKPQDFIYLEVNKAFEVLTGLKDVAGKKRSEVAPLIQISNPELIELYGRVASTGEPEDYETYIEPLDAWIRSSVYSPEEGYFAVVSENTTEKKRAEIQLRQVQKMVAVGQLAGGIAHDFNNILGAFMLQISLMQNDTGMTAEMRSALEELEKGAGRAATLTRQLLMFSRQQTVNIKRLDLNEVVTDMMKMLGRILGEHIALEVKKTPKPAWINADEGMMEQVIMNLCVNARDAMPNGGHITIATRFMQIKTTPHAPTSSAFPGRFLCLSVTDTGCGIAGENRTRIFEPFFTTKEVGKGTGLGLATVYGIVKQHEGWVEVESQIGEGSTFNVFLPVGDASHSFKSATATKQAPSGDETILLVEDDEALRSIVSLGLKSLGYHVMETGSGPEALQQWSLHKNQIALLFTDMVMPEGMTGLDLAKRLKSMSAKLKVIVTSGYSSEFNQLQGNPELGITFLNKPYEMSTLATTVRECLDQP